MLGPLLIAGAAVLVHLTMRRGDTRYESGRLYRTRETIALPKCQRCGRPVRRPLVVLRDDDSEREVYLGPACAARVLRTQEDVPELAPTPSTEGELGGTQQSCCDVEDPRNWKNDHPIDYKAARDSLHLKQKQDAERGRYWNVTHAMTLAAIGRNKKRRWRECRASCDERIWQGDPDAPSIHIELRGDDEIEIKTDPPMTARRTRGAWLLVDQHGATLSRHPTRDETLRAAQHAADLPF